MAKWQVHIQKSDCGGANMGLPHESQEEFQVRASKSLLRQMKEEQEKRSAIRANCL